MINLNVFLAENQWDERTAKIVAVPNRAFLNNYIARRKLDIDTIIYELSEKGKLKGMTVVDLKRYILSIIDSKDDDSNECSGSFVPAFKSFISQKGKPRTKEIYEITLSRLYRFCPDLDNLNFEDVTKDWLTEFDNYLSKTSPSRNARNIHLRNIRAVFNDAIDNEVTTFYPFRKFKIRSEATVKRALTVEQLRMLFNYPCEEHQRKYVDMFKLIFFLIGINTVDLLHLKENALENGRVIYRRAKTGRLYNLKLEPEAMEIIEKYRGKNFLLDVMDRYEDHRDFVKRMNDNLQLIGDVKRVGRGGKKVYAPLFPKLTTYWARHTWATIAASLDIPKETIAASLGHGGNTVTDIYIDFDRRKVDEANRLVIDYVLYGDKC